jgi:hypothetical protein
MDRDLRKFARQTNFRLIAGGIVLLFIIGDGLIYVLYGPTAAISGLLCLGIGMVPLVLILAALWIMDWIVKHANSE